MKSQKTAEESHNKENIKTLAGLLCYKHRCLSLSALEIDKLFLFLIKTKYFYPIQ